MADIHAGHFSTRGMRRAPRNMGTVPMPAEVKAEITDAVLSIFADMVNSGQTFQDAILAVYLSGLQHGATLSENQKVSTEDQP